MEEEMVMRIEQLLQQRILDAILLLYYFFKRCANSRNGLCPIWKNSIERGRAWTEGTRKCYQDFLHYSPRSADVLVTIVIFQLKKVCTVVAD